MFLLDYNSNNVQKQLYKFNVTDIFCGSEAWLAIFITSTFHHLENCKEGLPGTKLEILVNIFQYGAVDTWN